MSDSKEDNTKMDDNIRRRGGGGNSTENEKSKSQINAEYFRALEQWLNEVRSYRYSCGFLAEMPYALLSQQMNGISAPSGNINNLVPPITPFNPGLGFFNLSHQQQQQQQQQYQQQSQTQPSHLEEGIEYVIPPLWKRLTAEIVDFMFLFMMKMAITLIAIDVYDFFEFDKIDFLEQQNKLDYKVAIEITSKFVFLEVIHRILNCLYEAAFLCKNIHNQIGGATPGKSVMGIRVVLCNNVQEVENRPNVVKVFPGTDLGFGCSLARAFSKNLLLAIFFPICFPFFFNKFNRTTYDILCHSIVVEDRTDQNRNR